MWFSKYLSGLKSASFLIFMICYFSSHLKWYHNKFSVLIFSDIILPHSFSGTLATCTLYCLIFSGTLITCILHCLECFHRARMFCYIFVSVFSLCASFGAYFIELSWSSLILSSAVFTLLLRATHVFTVLTFCFDLWPFGANFYIRCKLLLRFMFLIYL